MNQISLQMLLDSILTANGEELKCILETAKMRYSEIWPECDLLFITAEGFTPEAHVHALQTTAVFLSQYIKNDLP